MTLEFELVCFVIAVGIMVVLSWLPTRSSGLAIAYIISLGFIHFWGGLIHAFPWYVGGETEFTQLGFHQFTWGAGAFVAGVAVLAPVATRYIRKSARPTHPRDFPQVPVILVTTGVVLYGFLQKLLANVPSIGAVAGCGGGLLVTGLCLYAWRGLKEKRPSVLVFVFIALAFLPFFTIVSSGFLGYGAGAALVVVAFMFCLIRPRLVALLFISFAVYMGFCTFMTYMRDRADIREEVWDEASSFTERLDRLKTTFSNFETVNFTDQDQLERIEGRLNQNDLVGRAVSMLDDGEVFFARGETFRLALIALVPRIFWPSKPVTAGSPDIVSYYTGLDFAEGTSVGVGQVMEGYINFGTSGVVVLFLVLGTVLGIVDAQAALKLHRGDLLGFVMWFGPGIGLLQPGGSLIEVTATVAASIVLVQGLRIALRYMRTSRPEASRASVWAQRTAAQQPRR
jgi:hypothetical protein